MNPITRRPGPGRGRPRKHPADGSASTDESGAPIPPGSLPPSSSPMGIPGAPSSHVAQGHPMPLHSQPAQKFDHQGHAGPPHILPHQGGPHPSSGSIAPVGVVSNSAPPPPESLPLEEEDEDNEEEDDEDDDEHVAKRQRMIESDLQDQSLDDDEAVLALAAHNGSGSADPYQSEFSYGEA
jgi:hypothetical protein